MSARRRMAPFVTVAMVLATSLTMAAATAWAQPSPPPSPTITPETSDCPNRKAPPAAPALAEKFERPTPAPLPVPDEPIGGPAMGECGIVLPEGSPPPPRGITAASWIVADVGTGQVLAAKDPHGRHRPASTIKLLTALLAVEQLAPDQVLTATRADVAVPGSSAGIVAGASYTVRQLLAGLLLQSGNGIAHALAREMGGLAETVRAMTLRARELGGFDTRVATPSGLEGPGMSTSAYDLALITRAVLDEPLLARLLRTEQFRFPGGGKGPSYVLSNDNDLLGSYPGALGGKTGYTDAARHTYVAIAERDGRRLVTVLMRGEQRPIPMWQQGARLLDYGFALPSDAAVGILVDPMTASERAAAQASPSTAALPLDPPLPELGIQPSPEPVAGATPSDDVASGESDPDSQALVGWLLVGAAAVVGLVGLFVRRRPS